MVQQVHAASAQLLPSNYRSLMTSPTSPISDFYPLEFLVDLEGKRRDYEAVVLIPFIDEERLIAAMSTVNLATLPKEVQKRNLQGVVYTFTHDPDSKQRTFCRSQLPTMLDVAHCNSHCVQQKPNTQ